MTWLLTWKTCHLFVLQNATNLDQWDSYTCCEDSRRHLDIMLAASLEWPLALRMALRVSMREDLTAGSDEFRSRPLPCTCLVWAGLDLPRTGEPGLLGLGPSALETMMLPVAVEWSVSPAVLVIERSSAELAGPSWMAGRRTRGPSPCPRAWTWHLSTPDMSGYGETNLTSHLLANVANISICGSPHLANTVRRLSMAIVHSVVRVWPTLDRESAWILRTPGRWTGTNVIALLSHHLSSQMVICIEVCDLVPPSFLMYATVTALSHISLTTRYLRWGRKSLTA